MMRFLSLECTANEIFNDWNHQALQEAYITDKAAVLQIYAILLYVCA